MGTIKEPGYQLPLFAGTMHSESIPLDEGFNSELANDLAKLESYNRHLYRPNTYLHKWWARRCGSTFRLILKHLVQDSELQDYYLPGGLESTTMLDPMMGGGTTLHEALRLGANVVGVDLDPIPILQARATLSKISLRDLNRGFADFYTHMRDLLEPMFLTTCPQCSQTVVVQYVLHGLRRRCKCGPAIFIDSDVLRRNGDGSQFSISLETYDILKDDQLFCRTDQDHMPPLFNRKAKCCEKCQRPYEELRDIPYFQRYAPISVVGTCPRDGLFFAAVRQGDVDAIEHADSRRSGIDFGPEADFRIPDGPKSGDLLRRGIADFRDLFSSRQLLYLACAGRLLDHPNSLVRLNLALLVSTSLEFNSMLCGYKGDHQRRPGAIRHTFSHHAYSFPYTSLENNPVYPRKTSGTLKNLFHQRIVRARQWALKPEERIVSNGRARKIVIEGEVDEGIEAIDFSDLSDGRGRFLLVQGSSVSLDLPDQSVDHIVTDPPYYDSVQYSDLAAFFRVWLRYFLPLEADWNYDVSASAVNPHTSGLEQYKDILSGIFSECFRVLKKPDGRLVFTFHHWNPRGWAELTIALSRARFALVNCYVVHSENPVSVHIANLNALVHDTVLVLAPLGSDVLSSWQLPLTLDTIDSMHFNQDCGQALGWMLTKGLGEEEIISLWEQLFD